jgi:hypothetical protein
MREVLIGSRAMREPLRNGWKSIESAPFDQDVTLEVTDGRGEPYTLKNPCKLSAAGWVSSGKGTPLAVTPLQWRPYYRIAPRAR